MQVIGIAGQLGNGKDVLADYLVEKLNETYDEEVASDFRSAVAVISEQYPATALKDFTDADIRREVQKKYGDKRRWSRSAFANAVKDVYCDTFAVNRDFIEAWKRNPTPPPGFDKNVRQSLQFIGDGFRSIKDGIWIEIALRDESKKLVISDSRYINEAKAVKAKGGLMVVLYRPGYLNDDPNPSEAQIKPVVEWCVANMTEGPLPADRPPEMEPFDFFIRNEGSQEDLYRKVDDLLLPWLEQHYLKQ